MKEEQILAMESLFAFSDAMNDGNLTIADLTEVFEASIAQGHDMLAIHLYMAHVALRPLKRKPRVPPPSPPPV